MATPNYGPLDYLSRPSPMPIRPTAAPARKAVAGPTFAVGSPEDEARKRALRLEALTAGKTPLTGDNPTYWENQQYLMNNPTGSGVENLGMSARTPEQQVAMDRTSSLLSGILPKAKPLAGTMATPGTPTGEPAVISATATAPAVEDPMAMKRKEASLKWRATMSLTDPAARQAAQDKLLSDYMDVADPKYLESRGAMGPSASPAIAPKPTYQEPGGLFAPRPGSREYNDLVRGDRALSTTLNRGVRALKGKGDYAGAAGLMSATQEAGFNIRPGTQAAREQNLLERTLARRTANALSAQAGGGILQPPKYLGNSQQQPGTQMNTTKLYRPY